MAGQYTVRIAGGFDMQTGAAERKLRRFQGSFGRLFQFTRRFRAGLLNMNTMLMGSGATMVAAGLAARGTVRALYDYSDANARIGSIIASVGGPMAHQRQLMEVSEVQARRYGHSLAEAGQAMGTLLETGVSTHESMRYFPVAARFARAAGVDLNDSTRVLVDSMRQFNMQSEEGANFLAGAFTVAGRMSSTSIHELQQAFRYASVEMAGLGYSAQETISALAGMSAIGLRSTTAGTRLRRMLVQLIRPTQTTIERFEEFGVSQETLHDIMYDGNDARRDLADTTLRLANVFQQFGTEAEQNEAAVRLFGVRGLAAGVMFSRLHQRGGDWLRVLRNLNDRQGVQNRLQEAADAGMRGFARQVDLLKIGLTDFGRVFGTMLMGNMEEGQEGFGTTISQLALAVRGAGLAEDAQGQLADSYRALSPEMREQGKELRETLEGLAVLVKILGKVGAWIGKLAGKFPTLTATLLIVGSVVRPIIPLFAGVGTKLLGLIPKLGAAKGAAAGFGIVFAKAVAILGGAVVVATALQRPFLSLVDWINGGTEATDEFNQAQERALRNFDIAEDSWIRRSEGMRWVITALDTIGEMLRVVGGQIADFWRSLFREGPTIEAQVDQRVRAIERSRGMTGGAAEQQAANLATAELRGEIRDMIPMMRASTFGGEVTRSEELTRARQAFTDAGMSTSQMNEAMHHYTEMSRRSTAEGRRGISALVGLNSEIDSVAENIGNLTAIIGEASARAGSRVTPVQDAYVQSAGWVPASAGDILVDRDSLANVMATRAGGLVGAGGAQQAGATPESQRPQNQTLDLTLEIPVMIDGREVARAIGHHTLQINQRRGASTGAGTRRRVAETGVA